MITHERNDYSHISPDSPIYQQDAFSRLDETDDAVFYQTDRFVNHLDETALHTVEHVIGSLVKEDQSIILDLMVGWDSASTRLYKTQAVGRSGLKQDRDGSQCRCK